MTTGIVVVVWNGERYLQDCINSVLSQSTPPRELIVIDNASVDGSVAIVRALADEAERRGVSLEISCNSGNVGFTCGANAGLGRLLSSANPVDCAVLLNQDAALEPDWCETVQRRFESDGAIAVVGSKIFHPNRLTIQHAGGYIEKPRMVGRHFGHHAADNRPDLNVEREVEFVTAAAMALRTSALAKAGCFQEIFSPGYYEDVDLCVRLREAGWKIVFCPDAIAIHVESASFNDRVRRLTLSDRSRLIYALRWLVDRGYREKFTRAERQHIQSDLSIDERRALTAAYLELLLMLPRAVGARALKEQVTPGIIAELTQMLVELRDQIVMKRWAPSSLP